MWFKVENNKHTISRVIIKRFIWNVQGLKIFIEAINWHIEFGSRSHGCAGRSAQSPNIGLRGMAVQNLKVISWDINLYFWKGHKKSFIYMYKYLKYIIQELHGSGSNLGQNRKKTSIFCFTKLVAFL